MPLEVEIQKGKDLKYLQIKILAGAIKRNMGRFSILK
jgi:hypothetical protein